MRKTIEINKDLKELGYKFYASELNGELSTETNGYYFCITPSDNVLYVQLGDFGYGYNISLQYVPSRQNGSGCRDNTLPDVSEITEDVLVKAETANVRFAHKLGAKLFENSQKFIDSYWTKLIKI